jgi:hypothetical protein
MFDMSGDTFYEMRATSLEIRNHQTLPAPHGYFCRCKPVMLSPSTLQTIARYEKSPSR